jgi:hypothetical protein
MIYTHETLQYIHAGAHYDTLVARDGIRRIGLSIRERKYIYGTVTAEQEQAYIERIGEHLNSLHRGYAIMRRVSRMARDLGYARLTCNCCRRVHRNSEEAR